VIVGRPEGEGDSAVEIPGVVENSSDSEEGWEGVIGGDGLAGPFL
jgi:hypothetical protein